MRAGSEWLSGKNVVLPVEADAVIHEGHMIALNENGYAKEAEKAENLKVAGCAMRYMENSKGAAGAVTVQVRRGAFCWKNDGTIKETDILKECYIADAKTVTLTAEGSSKAGKILGVMDNCVIVEMI